ncbi:MAG TPA: hypothetical protein VMY37_13225 [Thermoguttaceae bacterium]|nr:hypothetical protein [Thermoguttaceae bacterium]
MQNREVEAFPKQNYEVTVAAAHAAGDMCLEGGRYGRIVDTVLISTAAMMSCRGVFEIDKATTANTWSDRQKLEAVVNGTTKLFTVQALDKGVCIGEAVGATIGTDTFAKVELIPELN